MENKKIKVLVVPSDTQGGIWAWRTFEPHRKLQEMYSDEFEVDIVQGKDFPMNDLENFFKQYDLIQFHKQLDGDGKLLNMIKFLDIPMVQDLDDNHKLGPSHPLFISSQRGQWSTKVLNHTRNVDYVTTTTEIYAKDLRRHNPNVCVLPNAIDLEDKQFTDKKNPSDKIRFGIICGSTHEKDIKLMAGINSLPKEIKDKMQIVLCGMDFRGRTTTFLKDGTSTTRDITPRESVWCRYEDFLTNSYKDVTPEHNEFLQKMLNMVDDPFENDFYRRFFTKDIHHYGEHYQNVDVLLAPLEENDFNKMKSELKFTEAGFTNTAIIASNFGPYTVCSRPYLKKGGEIDPEGNCLLVEPSKNHKQWAKYIKYLVENPDVIKKLQENLSKQQREEYNLEKITEKRAELYRKIIKEHRERQGLNS